ncbi:MAG: DUF2088 domain-containing protein [Deltaproteobacteria bacterium]|nr:DUF2088 domain-containing protein [Deltaproteobacteria bacterium]
MEIGKGSPDQNLTESDIQSLIGEAFECLNLTGKRVLILIPDHTRSGPLPLLFNLLNQTLYKQVAKLDYLIALGTHQPLSDEAIAGLLGTCENNFKDQYPNVGVFNHHWEQSDTFKQIGEISASAAEQLSHGLLSESVPVTINKMIYDYDQLIVCGPVFPHEVAGFSGGNKYFFPGISGEQIIDFTHWLGALITSYDIIGKQDTPVRAAIDYASAMVDLPKFYCCYVVRNNDLAGLYLGPSTKTWAAACQLSSKIHIRYIAKPFEKVLSVMPQMYDDIWTAAKGMYKLEPVVADGGEVIIYAPHISQVSYTHGEILAKVGYHVRDYFVKQWDRFKHFPRGVLAHSTHLRGIGSYENGIEVPRINVSLATGISREECERLNLGWHDPDQIDPAEWANREDEGLLLVPHAGETLFRLKGPGV